MKKEKHTPRTGPRRFDWKTKLTDGRVVANEMGYENDNGQFDAPAEYTAELEREMMESHPYYKAGVIAGLELAKKVQSADAQSIFRNCTRKPERTPHFTIFQKEAF